MNKYNFSDIKVGMSESFKVTVTREMQNNFTKLSGDVNPMHINADYAKQNGYNDVLVYGMLTASLYSTFAGVYLPGEKCLLHECSVQFPRPVYIGDELTVTGKVSEIDKRFRRVTVKACIINQNGEKVSRAKLLIGVRE